MYNSKISPLLLFFFLAFAWKAAAQGISCFSSTGTSSTNCGDLNHYIPTANTPIKTVKIAFHVMQREAPFPKDNFDENNQAHVDFLIGLFNRLNDLYSNCNVMWCNCAYQSTNYTRDSRIRFELVSINYHRDNAGYLNEDGTYYNPYCIDNYGICKDEILNVFFCQIPGSTSGYGPPTHNMMFNQYDEYLNGNTNPWGAGNLMGHELGHTFGLGHSFCGLYSDMCQSETQDCIGDWCENRETDCTCGNNMMSYSRLSDFISPLQMAQMNKTLILGSVSKYLKTDYTPSQNITIATPTVWDFSRVVLGNVTIKPGASLTIMCKTIMAQNSRIIVERGARLIVDGALITTKGPTKTVCNGQEKFDRWTGIEVWGNTEVSSTTDMLDVSYPLLADDPGVVTLINNAIIENAQVGIFGQQRGHSWPSQLERFGGLISVDNAEFRNCRKAVEYISHFPVTVSSLFKNCRINQTILNTSTNNPVKTYEGVTSWQTNGMEFSDGCQFNNLERGIVLGNATASIIGSTFTLNKYAIEAGMVTPTADQQTFVGGAGANGNTFKHCEWPVFTKGYGFLIVYNNLFEDCYTGASLQGTSIFRIEENEFRNTTSTGFASFLSGIGLFQSGETGANYIHCNEYNTVGGPLIKDGIFTGGNNDGAYWSANKFDCWWDVRVWPLDNPSDPLNPFKGSMPSQGGPGNPVYNEFTAYTTPNPNPNLPPISTGHKADIFTPAPSSNTTNLFEYYPPTSNCLSQLLPRCPSSGTCSSVCSKYNFSNNAQGAGTSPVCSFGPINGILQPEDCRTRECLEEYYATIANLDTLLSYSPTDPIKLERKYWNNKKMSLLHHLTDSLYNAQDFEGAADLWSADPERFSREALVGLRIQMQDFDGAAQLLGNYPNSDPEDVRFKDIQTIHLNWLVQGESFNLSQSESDELYEIAESYSAQSGHAQTLLWALDDAMFEPVIPAVPEEPNERNPEIKPVDKAIALFNLYPNPAGNMLNINISHSIVGENHLVVRDVYGKLIEEFVLLNSGTINITKLTAGIYSATLRTPDGQAQTIFFVKSHQ